MSKLRWSKAEMDGESQKLLKELIAQQEVITQKNVVDEIEKRWNIEGKIRLYFRPEYQYIFRFHATPCLVTGAFFGICIGVYHYAVASQVHKEMALLDGDDLLRMEGFWWLVAYTVVGACAGIAGGLLFLFILYGIQSSNKSLAVTFLKLIKKAEDTVSAVGELVVTVAGFPLSCWNKIIALISSEEEIKVKKKHVAVFVTVAAVLAIVGYIRKKIWTDRTD